MRKVARLGVATFVATFFVAVAPAAGAATCTKTGAVVAMTADPTPTVSYARFADNGTMVIDDAVCAGALVTNVDTVTIDASGNHLAIYASVAIGPGLTPEADGASEVEIALSNELSLLHNDFTAAGTTIVVGRTGGERRLNLTAAAPGDQDADIVGVTAATCCRSARTTATTP